MMRITIWVNLVLYLSGCFIDQNDHIFTCDPADYEIETYTYCDTTQIADPESFCDYVMHETAYLLPESKEQTRYMCPDMHEVIFEDGYGNELAFLKTSVAEQNATQWSEPCNVSGEKSTLHCASQEETTAILRNDSLDLEFRILLNIDTRNNHKPWDNRDQLIVTIPKTADFGTYYSLVLSYYIKKGGAYHSFDPRFKYEREYILENKSYRDVTYFIPRGVSDRMEIYFSKMFGIIGFRDKSGILWTFKKYG